MTLTSCVGETVEINAYLNKSFITEPVAGLQALLNLHPES